MSHIIKGNADISNLDVSNTAKIRGKNVTTSVNGVVADALGRIIIEVGFPKDSLDVIKNGNILSNFYKEGFYELKIDDISTVIDFPSENIKGTGIMFVYILDNVKYQYIIDEECNTAIRKDLESQWFTNINTETVFDELKKYVLVTEFNKKISEIQTELEKLENNKFNTSNVVHDITKNTKSTVPSSFATFNLLKDSFRKLGDIGSKNLNEFKYIDENSDLGMYTQTDDDLATTENNYPFKKKGILMIYPNGIAGTQIYYPNNEPFYYKRDSISIDEFGVWVKFGIEYSTDPNIIAELNKKIDKEEALKSFIGIGMKDNAFGSNISDINLDIDNAKPNKTFFVYGNNTNNITNNITGSGITFAGYYTETNTNNPYSIQLVGSYYVDDYMLFRTYNGDKKSWNEWRQFASVEYIKEFAQNGSSELHLSSKNGKNSFIFHRDSDQTFGLWSNIEKKSIFRVDGKGVLYTAGSGTFDGEIIGKGRIQINAGSDEYTKFALIKPNKKYVLFETKPDEHDSFLGVILNNSDNSLDTQFRFPKETGVHYVASREWSNSNKVDKKGDVLSGELTWDKKFDVYSQNIDSTAENTATAKNYIRKFRNRKSGYLWHELVDENGLSYYTGLTPEQLRVQIGVSGVKIDGSASYEFNGAVSKAGINAIVNSGSWVSWESRPALIQMRSQANNGASTLFKVLSHTGKAIASFGAYSTNGDKTGISSQFQWGESSIVYWNKGMSISNSNVEISNGTYTSLSLLDSSKNNVAALVINDNGIPYLEWKNNGVLKGQLFMSSGNVATREWTNEFVRRSGNDTFLISGNKEHWATIINDGAFSVWHDVTKKRSFYVDASGTAEAASSFRAPNIFATRGSSELFKLGFNSTGSPFLSYFDTAGKWTAYYFPNSNGGTVASQEWSNSNHYKKTETYNKSEMDARYFAKNGGTINGGTTVSGNFTCTGNINSPSNITGNVFLQPVQSGSWISLKTSRCYTQSGTVSSGSAAPALRQEHADRFYMLAGLGNSQFGIYMTNKSTTNNQTDGAAYLNQNGDWFCNRNGSFIDVEIRSDIRSKDNIKLITSPLEKINQISGYTYNVYTDNKQNSQKSAGVIAQEVIKVLPEIVRHDDDTDLYKVTYNGITALLVESVKELSEKVKHLEGIIKNKGY